MFNRPYVAATLLAALALLPAAPVNAAVILITQAKALNGGVTPGDTPGFPVTLTLPGAYRLDTNLTVPANKNGIVVSSHHVDIDMNGFRLSGANAAGTAVAANGVVSAFGVSRIHDGVIASFKINGIFLTVAANNNSNAWIVEDMQIAGNGGSGIRAVDNAYSRFLNNSILVNGGHGIYCGQYCHVEGNTVAGHDAGAGVVLLSGTVLGNSIFSNKYEGIFDGGINDTGYGNNTLSGNNSGGEQVFGGIPLQPNACVPSPC